MKCNICQSLSCKPIKTPYFICKDCGHVYQGIFQPPEFYHSLPCHFPEDYEEHAVRRAGYIIDFLKPINETRLLDVGCGKGSVMRAITKLRGGRVDVYGCTLEKSSDPNIVSMDIEKDELPWNDFDILVLSHVLEHFRDPVGTLKKLLAHTAEDARVYIEVPSFYWGQIRIPSIFTPEHLSFFTPETLNNVLSLSGLFLYKSKESRYWGNIKTVSRKVGFPMPLKKVDYKKVLRYHHLVKLMYPWYIYLKKTRNIGPND